MGATLRRATTAVGISVAAVLAMLAGALTVATPAASLTVGRIVYTYEVRGLGNQSSLAVFAQQAAETYADGRGWGLGGTIVFRRVSTGGNFTLWLAAADRVPSFGYPCDSGFSCQMGRNVIINETRWLLATSTWNAYHRTLRGYRHMVVNHETGHWLGFGHAYCGGAGQLAPLMQQQSISLQGCLPNAWPLPSERQRLATSRGVPIITGSPFGYFDSARAAFAGIRVRGWMIDPNTTLSGHVHVYVDGRGTRIPANKARPDVARSYPVYGPLHGFAARVFARPGTHRVCVSAFNVAGPGGSTRLGCKSVTVSGSPGGQLDSVRAVAGPAVRVRGWAIDPDTTAAIRVNVFVDGARTSVPANRSRSDVAALYPYYGAQHGYLATVPTTPGPHRVCVSAPNAAGSGSGVSLGCRTVTVPA